MKRKVMLMWILFVVCVITTLVMRYFLERQDVEFEEVTVTVVSAEKKELENRKTNTTLTINDVKVIRRRGIRTQECIRCLHVSHRKRSYSVSVPW